MKNCKCGSTYIVNKTHSLCYNCNQIRLNGANWKEDKTKASKKLSLSRNNLSTNKSKLQQKRLKTVSDSNSFLTTNGHKVLKKDIDRRVKRAKKMIIQAQLDEYGYNFCVDCGINSNSGIFIDCSHTISVDKCQKNGQAELAWDKSNIKPRCRNCHNLIDKTYL